MQIHRADRPAAAGSASCHHTHTMSIESMLSIRLRTALLLLLPLLLCCCHAMPSAVPHRLTGLPAFKHVICWLEDLNAQGVALWCLACAASYGHIPLWACAGCH